MTLRRLLPATSLALVLLTGCLPLGRGEFLHLDAEEVLEPCTEVSEIPVEALDGPAPECEPVGSTLIFPDGGRLEVSSGGGSSSLFTGDPNDKTRSYGYQTVGIYGVVASTWLDECEYFESWGRPEAIAKVEVAFGEFLGQC